MLMGWIYLTIAVIFEVAAASCLKSSESLSKLLPSILLVVFYLICFAAMIKALETLPLGLMYAIWGGVGTALVALMSWYFFNEDMRSMKVTGIGLIVIGVVLTNLSTSDPASPTDQPNSSGVTSSSEAQGAAEAPAANEGSTDP